MPKALTKLHSWVPKPVRLKQPIPSTRLVTVPAYVKALLKRATKDTP